MKILVVCYEYPPIGGGGGRMAHTLAAALVRRGHSVRVQTAHWGDLPAREQREGVDIFRCFAFRRRQDACSVPEMAGFLATSFLPTLRHIWKWKPDVVHAHFAVPSGVLGYAAHRLTGVPYVLTAYLGDLPGGVPDQTGTLFRILDPLIRPIWKTAFAVTATSSFAADLANKAYGLTPHLILNGASMVGRPAHAEPVRTPLRLTAIGRFNAQKNFPWLVRCLASHASDLAWTLTFVGDGPERKAIEHEIRVSKLADRIRLAGWISGEEVLHTLNETDLLLMPSLSEGNPIAAIEALKCGVAILASDAPGIADLINDGVNGFRVPLQDPKAFAAKLRDMASNPELLYAMKEASLQLAQKFDIEQIAENYERVLGDYTHI